MKIKEFLLKYKHAAYLIYYPIVVLWFKSLEMRNVSVTNWIWAPIDYKIPFVAVFVVPYMLWFAFMAVSIAFLGFRDKPEYFKLLTSIYIGMTICCIIYFLYPHGQPLREPLTGNEKSVFDWLVANVIYANDTPTNCAPSIHVANSIFTTIALQRSKAIKKYKLLLIGAHLLNLLIIASTMFIKQHSVIDAILGVALAAVVYLLVYAIDWRGQYESFLERRAKRKSMQTA